MRIGVLGANGQVGAELCLLLANHPEVELVPISRNHGGSSFLRYRGIRCRHGLAADARQAAALLGDCEVVVHLALGAGTPQEMRKTERALLENAIRASLPGAMLIYGSTRSVYGEPVFGGRMRRYSSYGQIKLWSERLARRLCREQGKPCYILRLGHVCGSLQNISLGMRQRALEGGIRLPNPDPLSETVYVATLADAIFKIIAGRETPGVYDLLSHPVWTWGQVYAHEAAVAGVPYQPEWVPAPARGPGLGSVLLGPVRAFARQWVQQQAVKDWVNRALSHLPVKWNQRIQARWYRARAAQEISRLSASPKVDEAYVWNPRKWNYLRSLADTAELLRDPAYQLWPFDAGKSWPPDLPPAQGR